MAGEYTAVNPSNAYPRLVGLNVSLTDLTTATDLLSNSQLTFNVPDATLVLGGTQGSSSSLVGSLVGTLIAGHDYQLLMNSAISTQSGASPFGATASGYVSIDFVPEPGTAALLGIGLATLSATRRRRAGRAQARSVE